MAAVDWKQIMLMLPVSAFNGAGFIAWIPKHWHPCLQAAQPLAPPHNLRDSHSLCARMESCWVAVEECKSHYHYKETRLFAILG